MNISGSNLLDIPVENYSYYFSKYNHTWGWATWRRAWKNYRYDIFKEDQSIFRQWMRFSRLSQAEGIYWENVYLNLKEHNQTIWDYQWLFTVWKLNGVSITPMVNLVSNIGFGKDATHTLDVAHPFSRATTHKIELPLKHPSSILVDKKMDLHFAKNFFGIVKLKKLALLKRIYRKIKRVKEKPGTGKSERFISKIIGNSQKGDTKAKEVWYNQ